MKIVLKNESCIGCGACVGIDSEHFEFSEEGYSVIKSQENLDSPALTNAIEACPVAIISLVENDNLENDDMLEHHDCHCEEHCQCTEECHCEDHDCQCNEEEDFMDEAA